MLSAQTKARPYSAKGFRFAVVTAGYNRRYTDAMLAAAVDTLAKAGARPEQVRIVRVSGSFEIPVVIARLAASRKWDAIIAVGVILRGETAHADLIATAVTHRLSEIAVSRGVPIIHAVLLFSNSRQARARCLGEKHNRGAEAARTAIEMANVMKELNR